MGEESYVQPTRLGGFWFPQDNGPDIDGKLQYKFKKKEESKEEKLSLLSNHLNIYYIWY